MSKKSDKLLNDLLKKPAGEQEDNSQVSVYNKTMQQTTSKQQPKIEGGEKTLAVLMEANATVILDKEIGARVNDKTFEACVDTNQKLLLEIYKADNGK